MKRRWFILLVIFIVITALFGIRRLVIRQNEKQTADRMLTAVDLGGHSELDVYGYSSWTDPQKYKDGYEIMLLGSNREQESVWTPPDSWVKESLPVADLAERLQIQLNPEDIWQAGYSTMGGDHCDAWFFLDRRAPELPFEEQEYYLGYDIDIGNKKDNVLFALKVMEGTILIIDQTTYTGENNQ